MSDTIAAVATAPGCGGVGIVRVSGPNSRDICEKITGIVPKPRYAHYAQFKNSQSQTIDAGLAIYFKAPNSYTGEDVLELQAHGGPAVLDMLLHSVLKNGARMARPGEFTEQAFLNSKIDLVQAEAVADLISASSHESALAAQRSLQGNFSLQIAKLNEDLINLRLYVEAAIDFPEEEIDFLDDLHIVQGIQKILDGFETLKHKTMQGVLLSEGVSVAVIGKPNVGKSTLLNCLTGEDTAIVTDIAGTTRDVVSAVINLDGIKLKVLDTAGLRETVDPVEQIGISRTKEVLDKAQLIVLLVTGDNFNIPEEVAAKKNLILVENKIDESNKSPEVVTLGGFTKISISAKNSLGIDLLRSEIKKILNFEHVSEGTFMARRRHLQAMEVAQSHVINGERVLKQYKAGEILAEELHLAQQSLSEITGEFSADDLLGKIFSEFCIGK